MLNTSFTALMPTLHEFEVGSCKCSKPPPAPNKFPPPQARPQRACGRNVASGLDSPFRGVLGAPFRVRHRPDMAKAPWKMDTTFKPAVRFQMVCTWFAHVPHMVFMWFPHGPQLVLALSDDPVDVGPVLGVQHGLRLAPGAMRQGLPQEAVHPLLPKGAIFGPGRIQKPGQQTPTRKPVHEATLKCPKMCSL